MWRNATRRPGLRTRILASVVVVALVVITAFDIVAVTGLRRFLIERTDSTLALGLAVAAPRLDRMLAARSTGADAAALRRAVGSNFYLAFVPDGGKIDVLQADPSFNPALPKNLATIATSGKPETIATVGGTASARVRMERVDGGVLVAAASLDDVTTTVGQLTDLEVIGSLIALGLISAGVAVALRRGLRPLERIVDQADQVTPDDLARRVVSAGESNEERRLTDALNAMLDRIETSVHDRELSDQATRRFFADASHELRTPLASLRANAELFIEGARREPAQVDETMRRIQLEAVRMGALVDDMLRLARLDQQPDEQRAPVDVSALLRACVRRAVLVEPRRPWSADIAPDLIVDGDEELLRRAVDNLLANVRVHAPVDAAASLTADRCGSELVVVVGDHGPGVPTEELDRIFDRFHRVGGTSGPGSGLGLAIVAGAVAAHDGSVSASAVSAGGLAVTLRIPIVEPTVAQRCISGEET